MRLKALRLWRLDRGLDQRELAVRAGITSNRVAMIENGVVEPATEELNRISTILRVPAEELCGDGLAALHRLHASSK
jgi:transcriptional regulator with XRE-family HTH domain